MGEHVFSGQLTASFRQNASCDRQDISDIVVSLMSVLVRSCQFYDTLPIGESIILDALLDVNMINSTSLKACSLKSRMTLVDIPPLDLLLSVLGFANEISCGIHSLNAHGGYRR